LPKRYSFTLETTSKLGERSELRVWEKAPVEPSIAGEESPVPATKKLLASPEAGSFLLPTEFCRFIILVRLFITMRD